jgi:hypothetical protein
MLSSLGPNPSTCLAVTSSCIIHTLGFAKMNMTYLNSHTNFGKYFLNGIDVKAVKFGIVLDKIQQFRFASNVMQRLLEQEQKRLNCSYAILRNF